MINAKHIKITPDGTVEAIRPGKKLFSVKELRKIVGGNLEVYFTTDKQRAIIMNDNGNPHNMPYNKVASDFFNANTPYMNTVQIKGTVAIIDINAYDPLLLAKEKQMLIKKMFGNAANISHIIIR
ncbi:hypothetical protein GCM10027443_18030 [Pontibacter brevis]